MTDSTIPRTETVIKTVSRDLTGRKFIVAQLGLRKLEGNPEAYWSATAEMYEPRGTWSGRTRFNNDREPDTSGALDIARAWPQLAPIVALHLSDADGVPMHALANGVYHLGQGNREAAARLWRVALEDLPEFESGEEITAYVDAQRERWARESSEAWAILEGLR